MLRPNGLICVGPGARPAWMTDSRLCRRQGDPPFLCRRHGRVIPGHVPEAAMLLWPVIALAMAAPACCKGRSWIYPVAAVKLRLVLGKCRQELKC